MTSKMTSLFERRGKGPFRRTHALAAYSLLMAGPCSVTGFAEGACIKERCRATAALLGYRSIGAAHICGWERSGRWLTPLLAAGPGREPPAPVPGRVINIDVEPSKCLASLKPLFDAMTIGPVSVVEAAELTGMGHRAASRLLKAARGISTYVAAYERLETGGSPVALWSIGFFKRDARPPGGKHELKQLRAARERGSRMRGQQIRITNALFGRLHGGSAAR